MSIALSAIVRPSRLLRMGLLAYGAGHLAMALALAGGWCQPMAARWPAACACLLAGALAGWKACQIGTVHRIDISGIGELRVTVQRKTAQASVLMRLEAGSTLWPRLLCLRLAGPDGRRCTLLIAPDSVAPDALRALAVALRSIAGRDNIFFEKNKIV
jgi:toxin CptA